MIRQHSASRGSRFRLLIAAVTIFIGPSEASSQAGAWSLLREATSESADGSGHAMAAITHLVIGGDGNIVVAQPEERAIRMFSREGVLLGSIGGAGANRVDFSRFFGPIGFVGDTLWVADQPLERVTFFDLAGRLLYSARIISPAVEGKFLASVPIRVLDDGSALVSPGRRGQLGADSTSEQLLIRIDRAGVVLDTVARVRGRPEHIAVVVGEMVRFTSQPFADSPLTGISPSGRVVVVVQRKAPENNVEAYYQVTQLNVNGDTAFSRRYEYAPVPLPDEEIKAAVSAKSKELGVGPLFGSIAEAERYLWGNMFIPKYRVPVSRLLVTDDGSVWLRREGREGHSNSWEILDRFGDLVAKVVAPAKAHLLAVEGETVWAFERNSHGMAALVRFRLVM